LDVNSRILDSGIFSMIITGIIVLVLVGSVIAILSAGIRGASGHKGQENLTPEQINTISTQLAGTGGEGEVAGGGAAEMAALGAAA